eukprot:9612-Chlamydomonas_euryale.AAC.4
MPISARHGADACRHTHAAMCVYGCLCACVDAGARAWMLVCVDALALVPPHSCTRQALADSRVPGTLEHRPPGIWQTHDVVQTVHTPVSLSPEQPGDTASHHIMPGWLAWGDMLTLP